MGWRTYTEDDVNALVRRHLASPMAKRLKLRLRRYQVLAAMASYEHMVAGTNVVLNLPTGTGKTMVANILSIMMLESCPNAYCLYLAPARSLAYQHRHYSRWLAPQYHALLLLDERGSPERIHTLSLRSRIIISTPELCANLIRAHVLPREVIGQLCMISIDEFDDHFVFGYSDNGATARLDAHLQKFYNVIPQSVPVQLVSATDPKRLQRDGNRDQVVQAFSALMDEAFHPEVITVPRKLYERYMPTAAVQPVTVNDDEVFALARAVSVEMALAFDHILDETGYLVSRDFVLTRLEAILSGSISSVRLMNGQTVSVSSINNRHFLRLRDLLNHHEHLYEDMFAGFDYEVRETRIFSLEAREFVITLLPRLIDKRGHNEFHTFLRSKARVLTDILNRSEGKRGVLFSRKIRLSDALFKETTSCGWKTIQVDSRFPDRERDKRLTQFRNGVFDLLIITRRTGRRGLDLPQADFAIFYSPKARETTTWQELSRIRSSVHRTKTSYLLNYGATPDARRMASLLEAMQYSGREYTLLPAMQFGEYKPNALHAELLDLSGFRQDDI